MKKQKAITPVVAIVLLLMITVGSLILLYGWIRGFQSSTQEGVEKSQHRIERNVATQIEIVSVSKDDINDSKMDIVVREEGDIIEHIAFYAATLTLDGKALRCPSISAIFSNSYGRSIVTYVCDYPFTNLIDGHTHTIKVRIGDITASVVCGPLDNGDTACDI